MKPERVKDDRVSIHDEPESDHPAPSTTDQTENVDPLEKVLAIAKELSQKQEWTARVQAIETLERELSLDILEPKVNEFCSLILVLTKDQNFKVSLIAL